jgi:glutamate formiminotransferase/formiminotetrahydrofolate cyclodeaminase
LVGLTPQVALTDAAQWYLQLDGFRPEQVLETRLFEDGAAGTPESTFLDRLADGAATPGGGSAAAHAGATGAALAAMVARLTLGKKKYADVQQRMEAIANDADQLRGALTQAVVQDARAFEAVMAAMKMLKETEAEQRTRTEAIERATHKAAELPLEVCRSVVRVLELLAEVAEIGNVNAVSDAASGAAMAGAAFRAAGLNVKVNASSVADKAAAQKWLDTLHELESEMRVLEARVHQAVRQRAGVEV